MAVVNFKAIGAGASAFLIFYAIFTFSVGFEYQDELGNIGFWLLPIFIAPGFVADAIAKPAPDREAHGPAATGAGPLLAGLASRWEM